MIYKFNNIELDTDNFRLLVDHKETSVEPQVFNLIVFLIENGDTIVSRDRILDHVWKGRVVSDTSINNHIKSARKALGDDGTKQQVIKTIHSRGYQFVAKINKPSERQQETSKLPHYFFTNNLRIAALLVIALASFYLFNQNLSSSKQYETSIYKIAVMPFFNSKADSESDYYGFAIADQVIGELNYLQNISVRPSSSVRKYITGNFQPEQVGSELDVDYLLSGHYLKVKNDIRLNIELIDINNKKILWRGKPIQTNSNNLFQLQDIVVKQVIEGLKLEFSTQSLNSTLQDVPKNPLAYEYYLRSIAYPYTTGGHQLAVEMLKQSMAIDDQYAPVYIQLGNRVRRLAQFGLVDSEILPNTEDYFLKALSLNPDLLDALAYLSMFYTESNRIDEALELARYMYQINPNNANTHFTLGYIYRYAGLQDEAIDRMEKAVALDSKNIKFRSLIGTYSAIGQYQKALEMTSLYEPSPFTYGWQALMNMQLGNIEKSLELFDYILEHHPQNLWANVAIIHKSYLLGEPKSGLDAILALVNTNVNDGETIYYTAAYYGLLGEKQLSINLLRKAIHAGYFNYQNMQSNEYFDSFKSTPEFQQVVYEAKLKHLAFVKKHFPEK